MVDKKVVNNRLVNIADKKLLLGLFAVFLIGTLFSGNLTGNAGRIEIVNQLDSNEFNLYEGSSHKYNGNDIVLRKISSDGTIIVNVVTDYENEQRVISPGHELYVNGYFITNVATNTKTRTAVIRVR